MRGLALGGRAGGSSGARLLNRSHEWEVLGQELLSDGFSLGGPADGGELDVSEDGKRTVGSMLGEPMDEAPSHPGSVDSLIEERKPQLPTRKRGREVEEDRIPRHGESSGKPADGEVKAIESEVRAACSFPGDDDMADSCSVEGKEEEEEDEEGDAMEDGEEEGEGDDFAEGELGEASYSSEAEQLMLSFLNGDVEEQATAHAMLDSQVWLVRRDG